MSRLVKWLINQGDNSIELKMLHQYETSNTDRHVIIKLSNHQIIKLKNAALS